MKINFSLLTFSDLDGNKAENIHKVLGNTINKLTLDFDLADIAKAIYNGEEVELSQTQVEAVKVIIKHQDS